VKALLLIAVCLLTACAQHTIDKDSAVQQSVDQQNRHLETMGVPRNHQPQPQVPLY
jgi:outer membrane biogenesis lipoprotein LolB